MSEETGVWRKYGRGCPFYAKDRWRLKQIKQRASAHVYRFPRRCYIRGMEEGNKHENIRRKKSNKSVPVCLLQGYILVPVAIDSVLLITKRATGQFLSHFQQPLSSVLNFVRSISFPFFQVTLLQETSHQNSVSSSSVLHSSCILNQLQHTFLFLNTWNSL